jgi:hypothetical protein
MAAPAPAPADLSDDVATLKHFVLTQAAHYESVLALLREQGNPVRASSPRLLHRSRPVRRAERIGSEGMGWGSNPRHRVSLMDSLNCQTATVSPAESGGSCCG